MAEGGRRPFVVCSRRSGVCAAPLADAHCGSTSGRRAAVLAVAAAPLGLPATAAATAARWEPRPAVVVVAGATGGVGAAVVEAARARGLAVRAPPRAELDVVQSSAEELRSAVRGADAVVSCVGVRLTTGGGSGPRDKRRRKTGKTGAKANTADAVDRLGVERLVDASAAEGVGHFVLVSALLTNAPAIGQGSNGAYQTLELLGGILSAKHASELYLRRAGLPWTIVRPGELASKGGLVEATGLGARVAGEDSLLAIRRENAISRAAVAELVVESLFDARARDVVVEVDGAAGATTPPPGRWFDFTEAPA